MKFKVEEKIIPPKEMIVGDPDAKVLIVEYGDYESADTARIHDIMQQLLETYKGKIKYNFRHFPLTRIHQRSFKAAEAAIAAGQEGKFWEMHNILLNHQRNLGTISLKGYARDVGVTRKHFLDDLMNSKFGWYVRDDQMQAVDAGVTDVPAIFINGERFEGKPTLQNLSAVITQALKSRKKVSQRA
ncbi:MAG TPA: thioredoxin domain-containing protein [Agriterribacter sp.]|nr:thioredoxin domain-containing protein [Agriterribacter sp.]HRQ50417.1 thioredoxin domain-containing protein [Agriterribacter sp.]